MSAPLGPNHTHAWNCTLHTAQHLQSSIGCCKQGKLKQQQQQLAHLGILEAALANSKADTRKAQAHLEHLGMSCDRVTY